MVCKRISLITLLYEPELVFFFAPLNGLITYERVLASPAVSCMSGSSSLDSFRAGRQVAV